MGCWTASAILIPALLFAIRAATDFSSDPPRVWHRPATYGHSLFLAALLWSIGWLGPTVWRHRNALNTADRDSLARLGADLAPLLPAGLGAITLGAGLLLLTAAWTRIGDHPHCRRCGYQQAAGGRLLTPKCPECGQRWSWFGSIARGAPHFNPRRAALGSVLSLLGLTGIVGQGLI
jgi:hypothetical protein